MFEWYGVKHVSADIYNFKPTSFDYCELDVQVEVVFVDARHCMIVAKRLDCYADWPESMQVMLLDNVCDPARVFTLPEIHNGFASVTVEFTHDIEPTANFVQWRHGYILKTCGDAISISRDEFNEKFKTELVVLPSSLYAVGIHKDNIYMYNEKFDQFYNVIHVVKHIARVSLSDPAPKTFHFVISSCDGYMEAMYWEPYRTIPRIVSKNECVGLTQFNKELPDEYAVYDVNNRHVVGMSTHANVPYVLDITDRHYFFHNLYNSFRSFHRGIPWRTKEPKIVYAGQSSRGNKYNFMDTRDTDMNPRDYFASEYVPKTNIVSGGWIDRTDMVKYRYILDIPGNGATWDGTAWRLNSGSVLFRSKTGWRQWFYADFKAGEHYIEIADDFSDIDDKFEWCEAHPEECERMVANCLRLFQSAYCFHNVMQHTYETIEKLCASQQN